ncbi:MAG: hypothetical protein HZR80_13260 [Candidatus Heimdallarchaeota archaeon]
MIPKFMLKKLYLKGSLKQEGEEISFQLLNTIYPATIIGLDPLKIDEKEFDASKIKVIVNEKEINLDSISEENPFKLTKGDTFTFKVSGKLELGKHTIDFSLFTKEAGKIAFDVEDEF